MAMVRYSDDDRERMRQEDEAIRQFRRREEVYFEFLCETGRVGTPDRTPVDPRWQEKLARLRIDPTSKLHSDEP